MNKGNYPTKEAAEAHAKVLRREFPHIKPIRVVPAFQGYDITTEKGDK